MMPICDLHTHSVYSDGTFTPRQLLEAAREAGVSAIALCDHNTVAGLPEFLAAARESAVRAIPGVEFSTVWEGTELHILGLFIREEQYGAVTDLLEDMLRKKVQSNRRLMEKLNALGISLSYEQVAASTPNGQVNRAVIGHELVRLGYCASVKEAFARWLSADLGYYVPPERPSALDVISFIKSIGAAAVFAHPFLTLPQPERVERFLTEAKPRGLDGMEVYYSTYTPQTTALAEATARKFGLLCSGGSDFHGENKPDIQLGTGRGDLRIPLDLVENLEKCCQ